jgi:hypothetical protein
MPFQSEKQKKWMWANKPEMAREWTQEYGSKVKAKTGTMAKKDDKWIQKATKNMRKDKPCTGKKFGSPTCPPGSRRYNLAKTFRKMNKPKKAFLGKMFRKSSTATPASQSSSGGSSGMGGLLRQLLESKKHLFNKAGGGPIKAKHGYFIPVASPHVDVAKYIDTLTQKEDKPWKGRIRKEGSEEKIINKKWSKGQRKQMGQGAGQYPKVIGKVTNKKKTGPIGKPQNKEEELKPKLNIIKDIVGEQVKGGPYKPGWKPQLSVRKAKRGKIFDSKKVSPKTHERFMKLFKHRERGGWKDAKDYKRYLTSLGAATKKTKASTAMGKANRAFGKLPYVKRIPFIGKGDPSDFLKRKRQLSTAGAVGKTLLKRTGLGKAVLAATAVAGAYEAGKRKLFTKDKKKVQKKATGGEIIIGRGVDMDLL